MRQTRTRAPIQCVRLRALGPFVLLVLLFTPPLLQASESSEVDRRASSPGVIHHHPHEQPSPEGSRASPPLSSPGLIHHTPHGQPSPEGSKASQPLSSPGFVRCTIHAQLSPDLSWLEGTLSMEWRPENPVNSIYFLLFPQQLSVVPEELDDEQLLWRYPGRPDTASLTFAPKWRGIRLKLEQVAVPSGWQPGTLMRAELPVTAAPGESLRVEGHFRLKVPHRYGAFGRALGQLTLAGGWFPILMIPPDHTPAMVDDTVILGNVGHDQPGAVISPPDWRPLAGETRVTLTLPEGRQALLNEQPLPSGEEVTAMGTLPRLVVGKLPKHSLPGPLPITLYDRRNRPSEQRVFRRLMVGMLTTWEGLELPLPRSGPTLVRAPLRRTLTVVNEGGILISDRLLRVFPLFRRFHEHTLVHAIYQWWLMDLLRGLESDVNLPWVTDGLAWRLVDVYHAAVPWGDLTLADLIRPLSFIPGFDLMLNAPHFAFAGQLYNAPYAYDALGQDAAAFLHRRPSGRVLFMKLEDRVGREALSTASEAVLRRLATHDLEPARWARTDTARDFLSTLADQSGSDVADLQTWVRRWRLPLPQVDYQIRQVTTRPVEEHFETQILIAREAEAGAPNESVLVRAWTRHDHQDLLWSGDETQPITLSSSEPIRRVVLDPDHRLLEVTHEGRVLRDNNDHPPRLKLMATAVPGSIDLLTLRPYGMAAAYLTRPHDRRWLTIGQVYSNSNVVLGSTLAVYRYLGPQRDALWRVHRVGGMLVAARRARWDPSRSKPQEATLDTYGLRLSYRYEDRSASLRVLRGTYGYGALEAGLARTPSTEKPYAITSLGIIRPLALHPRHVLVARGWLDIGLGLPDWGDEAGQGLFSLGGASALRGLPSGEGVGNRRWLTSLEYRWMVAQDLDIRIIFQRIRGVELVAFVDGGAVGQQQAGFGEARVGVGGGLRLHLATFGIWPALLGLDMAKMITEEGRWLPLLSFRQPF